MATPFKINNEDLKTLKDLNPKTVEALENARNAGIKFNGIKTLRAIGISNDEIKKLPPNLSFSNSDPSLEKKVTIRTDLKGVTGYFLIIEYRNKDTEANISEQYAISHKDETIIIYNESIAKDDFFISVKAPNGILNDIEINKMTGTTVKVKKADLGNHIIQINKEAQIKTQPNKLLSPTKLKGRLLSSNSSRKLEKIQIVIEAAWDKDKYIPICFAETEQSGYFITSQVQIPKEKIANEIIEAQAKIGIIDDKGISKIVPIALEPNGIAGVPPKGSLPEKVILFIEENAVPSENEEKDCHCNDCDLDFYAKKAVEEFSYYTVVRTTEPQIESFEIRDVDEIDLNDLLENEDNDLLREVASLQPSRAILLPFIKKFGVINHQNLPNLKSQIRIYNLENKLRPSSKNNKGRIYLEGPQSVDWDEKPTIYQATTIAHGHLLNFKQEWFNTGYTIGDLLYSLPLAPGQKKQIVVFDWDRKDSASNSQQLDYQENLYNSLSRDRDINEVAKATLKEHSEGNSSSDTWGWGVGGGVGAIIPTPVPIGALVGAGGGAGGGSSTASQDSKRTTTANSHQTIRDRTVQAANSVRSQRSTVIQTVSQGERFQVSAEVVANYNHCHAMTVQYFEVLRHFEIRTRLADVQECLFIPLNISLFDRKKALRWRDILFRALKKPFLRSGFESLERIEEEMESTTENYYDKLGIPQIRYAEERLEYIEGEMFIEFRLTRPQDNTNGEFELNNWVPFAPFLGNAVEFFDTFLKNDKHRDEAFIKHAGPKIAEAVINQIHFHAIKNGSSSISKHLPIDATLVSDFKNNKPLNVSLRMSGSMLEGIKREDVDFVEISIDDSSEIIKKLLNEGFLKMVVHSGSMRYRTKNLHEYLFRESRIKNDLSISGDNVRIFTPLSTKALKNPRLEDVEISNSLLHHLNENLEYYHKCIWFMMDAQRRFMLLDGLIAPGNGLGRSVASVVENKLIGIVGNCIVMPVAAGFQLDPLLDKGINLFEHYYEDPKDPIHISLPTKGVFAEAVMGKCNSCEKKEEARFWRWEESPIPDSPTGINPFTLPTPQNIQPNDLQPKDFPTPIINLQTGATLPDPQGYGSLLSLMSNPNLFRDITGLTENQKNALAALQGAFGTAQFFGGQAAGLTNAAANMSLQKDALSAKQNSLEQIKKAKENGLIDEKQAQNLTQEAFRSILGNSGTSSSNVIDDLKKAKESVDKKELSVETGKEVEDVILDLEHAKVENIKTEAKNKNPLSNNTDLELFVTFRNVDGRILNGNELKGFDSIYVFEGVGGPESGNLQFSESRFGALIQNFKISSGELELQLADSGGIPFSGKDIFTLSRTAKGLIIDAKMDKRTIDVTFNDTESITTSITNTLSGNLGGKISNSAKLSLATIIEASNANEINASIAAAKAATDGNTNTTGVSITYPLDIPTGNLTLKIKEI